MDHERVMEVLGRVLELPPDQRPAFLEDACQGDVALREELASLVAAHDAASGFLEMPPLDAPEPAAIAQGQRIGAYRIASLIGEGGMGAVYRAVRADDEFQQQVAIKLIRRGMDTDFVISRFRTERQILARLEHPHIARLLDGGTTDDGLPYFVMECIDGTAITQHCAQAALPMRRRLELFRLVCDAVHYAHQHLVVHRDLKPGNVLLTREGEPKLLDFGIAKILEPGKEGEATTLLLRPMTPEYASPEQIRGEPVTTATDVYQLGLLLFELLAEQRAFGGKAMRAGELERAICESEAPKPSSVARQRISPDLDNIVRKALEKEPRRRYGSALEFSEDVRRYLEGLPVAARPSTLGYRVSKFVRRNRVPVLAASLLLLTLVAGLAGTLWQARRAQAQRLRAERRFSEVRSLAHSFLFQFHAAIAELPGSTPARELVVKTALQYLESLARESQGDTTLERELAEAYEKVGEIQGLPGSFNLGDTKGALASFRKAGALRESLVRANPENADVQRELARNYRQTGRVLFALGEHKNAVEMFRKTVGIAEKLEGPDPNSPPNLRLLADGYMDLGVGLGAVTRDQSSLDSRAQAVKLYEKLAGLEPSLANRRNLAQAYKTLAGEQSGRGMAESLATIQKAVAIEEAVVRENPGNAAARMALAVSYAETGVALRSLQRYREAVGWYAKSLEIREALAAADPKNARIRTALAYTHNDLGEVLLKAGDAGAALRHVQTALAMRQAEVRADPGNATNRTHVAISETALADVHAHNGRCGPAVEHYRIALDIYDELQKSGKLSALFAKERALAAEKASRCR